MAEPEKKLPRIEISAKRCKGCSICIDFCPTQVLVLKGTVCAVQNLAACTRCQLCDLRCPDFAIQVFD